MLIDWFTVGAQLLNFLVLAWLLKRFLYRPILDALDAREQRIAAELADADARRAEAKKERAEFQHKNETFEGQRAALMREATEAAQAERQRLLDEARLAADALKAKRMQSLSDDAWGLDQALRRRTEQEVFAIARQALADLADASLEQRMAEIFIRRLRALEPAAKEGFANALKATSAPARVRSAFDLPAEQRAAIQTAINETFAADPSASLRTSIKVEFETAPERICGIELSTEGQKMAWNIADYLASLAKGVDELVKAQAVQPPPLSGEGRGGGDERLQPKPESKPDPTPT
jgi:F-type H+-transporting ATPase subunit b